MMSIATISLVTVDPSSCSLAAADDHAWPQCGSTAPGAPLSRPRAPVQTLVSPIIRPFGPLRHSGYSRHRRPLHRRSQPNPHSAR